MENCFKIVPVCAMGLKRSGVYQLISDFFISRCLRLQCIKWIPWFEVLEAIATLYGGSHSRVVGTIRQILFPGTFECSHAFGIRQVIVLGGSWGLSKFTYNPYRAI